MNKDTSNPMPADFKTMLASLDTILELYLVKKAPSLPQNAKEFLVKYAPYISILVVVLALPPVFALLGIGAIVSPFAYMSGVYRGSSLSLSMIFLLISVVIEAMAIPGLFARKASGWKLMYYGVLINAVYQLLRFDLGGLIVSSLISLYFLYQVKSFYK